MTAEPLKETGAQLLHPHRQGSTERHRVRSGGGRMKRIYTWRSVVCVGIFWWLLALAIRAVNEFTSAHSAGGGLGGGGGGAW
jgi:hypothetical protein